MDAPLASSPRPSTVCRRPSLYPMCGSTIFPCARGLPAARRSDVWRESQSSHQNLSIPIKSTGFVTGKGPSFRIGPLDAPLASSPPPSTVDRPGVCCLLKDTWTAAADALARAKWTISALNFVAEVVNRYLLADRQIIDSPWPPTSLDGCLFLPGSHQRRPC